MCGVRERREMRKMGLVFVVSPLVVMSIVACACADFRVNEYGDGIWTAPDGGWVVGTKFKAWRVGTLADVLSRLPADAEVAKMYRVLVAEPGEWMGFAMKLVSVDKVVFTKSTKIVLIDRDGKRYESETCLFTPDRAQTEVYDTRKMAVVVTRRSVWCGDGKGHPSGVAKFAEGDFRMEDIVEFEVVGAIVEGQGETK
ncbi:MAG: hypothetical protein NTX17_05295 [Candidatus Eisenbacteria bacterium]|nr:hypothetical protein [Candidatus Eisenbacteria bacterium]